MKLARVPNSRIRRRRFVTVFHGDMFSIHVDEYLIGAASSASFVSSRGSFERLLIKSFLFLVLSENDKMKITYNFSVNNLFYLMQRKRANKF